jgi:hypothetical protein
MGRASVQRDDDGGPPQLTKLCPPALHLSAASFFEVASFKPPRNLGELTSRLSANVDYYQANYSILVALVLLYVWCVPHTRTTPRPPTREQLNIRLLTTSLLVVLSLPQLSQLVRSLHPRPSRWRRFLAFQRAQACDRRIGSSVQRAGDSDRIRDRRGHTAILCRRHIPDVLTRIRWPPSVHTRETYQHARSTIAAAGSDIHVCGVVLLVLSPQ